MSTGPHRVSTSTKREVANLYEEGVLSEEAAREILGVEWEAVDELGQLLDVIAPDESDFEDDELLLE